MVSYTYNTAHFTINTAQNTDHYSKPNGETDEIKAPHHCSISKIGKLEAGAFSEISSESLFSSTRNSNAKILKYALLGVLCVS